MAFSIVAFDPANGDLGGAVASKFPCLGAVVPWAKAGVGAIATQSWANTDFGAQGLALLENGTPARQARDRVGPGAGAARERHAGAAGARPDDPGRWPARAASARDRRRARPCGHVHRREVHAV